MKRGSESPLNRFNKSINRTDLSPRRSAHKPHTVYHEDKLKVFIKFKPNLRDTPEQDQVRFVNDREVEVKTALKNKMYQFDHVFNGQQTHNQVFEVGCKEVIDHVFMDTHEKDQGNNGLIFVYGNTGTGKTYSMGLLNLMSQQSEGIVPNSLRYIFEMKKRKCYQHYGISISFCEVYMDEVYDLLEFESESKLIIREDSKTKQPFLENQTIIAISSVEQAFQIINIGLEKRRVAEQKMNRRSSRGHGLITVHLSPSSGEKPGKICFIDLAGCERLKDSQSKGVTLNEALHINSSLSTLETLLMNISDQQVRNYRASKLTRILQPYIEHGRINLFVTSTADSTNAVEFAKRCKGIRFLERELRTSTPIKRSNITEKGAASKSAKELEELLQFRRESIEREKKLLACILNLNSVIIRLSSALEEAFRSQALHSKFSFSDILDNLNIEARINAKIQEYEAKEQRIIQHNLCRLESNRPWQISAQDVARVLEQPQEMVAQGCREGAELGNAIKALGAFAQYRSVYKREFFASEFKLQLLEDKCNNYEHNIHGLMKFLNVGDKRVVRKLKEMGVTLPKEGGKENVENMAHLRNKGRERVEAKVKDRGGQQEELFNSQRRSAIYIDQA